jgi:hypothetical protein
MYVLRNKTLKKRELSPKCKLMKRSVPLIGVKKYFHKNIESLKKKYFGKKGMSVLVGSFTWKNEGASAIANRTTTDIQSASTFTSQSYILALTTAAQTELDTLSGGELILKQFKGTLPPFLNKNIFFFVFFIFISKGASGSTLSVL